MTFRSGYVAVLGRPNVGKSSLVNAMVGQKVAIVSDKAQTTRMPVRGILTGEDHQVVFTDTPGFHKPRTALGERLNRRVGEAADGVDVVMLVVDAEAGVGDGDRFVAMRQIAPHASVKICAVNKIDRVRHPALVPQLVAAAELADFAHVVPVSARTGRGLTELGEVLVASLPEAEPPYLGGEVTDQPMELRVAEIVREKALAVTREEVPHSVAVLVDEVRRNDETGMVTVSCLLFVERQSQKGILIGHGGQTLKEIGTQARRELELLYGSRVYLDIRVKVQKDWQRDPAAMARLGL